MAISYRSEKLAHQAQDKEQTGPCWALQGENGQNGKAVTNVSKGIRRQPESGKGWEDTCDKCQDKSFGMLVLCSRFSDGDLFECMCLVMNTNKSEFY